MGRSLETDVRDAAARPGGSGAARGSRVQFVLRPAPLLPASLLLAILVSVTVTTGLAGFAGRALPAAAHARLAHATAAPIQISGQFGVARAHVTLTAGTWPGPRRAGAPLAVALPATTASLLHFPSARSWCCGTARPARPCGSW